MHMNRRKSGGTLKVSAAEDEHTRRAHLETANAGRERAALRPGPFLSAARSVSLLKTRIVDCFALFEERQLDFEAVAVETANLTTVQASDAAGGEEPQTRARLSGFGGAWPAIEAFEEVQEFFRHWTRTATTDLQAHAIAHPLGLHANRLGGVAVLQGIAEQRMNCTHNPLSIPGADAAIRNSDVDRTLSLIAD